MMFTRLISLATVLLLAGCVSSKPVVFVDDDAIPDTAVVVRQGESLMNFGFRLQQQYKFQRVLFDLSYRGNTAAARERRISFGDISDVSAAFSVPGLKAYQIADHGGHSLVFSDGNYEGWQRLQVFDVNEGFLMENAQRLAAQFGWSLPAENWKADDFETKAFPLVVSDDPREAFDKLLRDYPAAADLNPNNKFIQVNSRLHSKQF